MGASRMVIGRLSRWEWGLDAAALVAVVVTLVSVITTAATEAVPAFILGVIAVCIRRHFPKAAAGTAVVSSGVVFWSPDVAVPIWVLAEVVLFSLAIRESRRVTIIVGGIHALLLYAGAIVVLGALPHEPISLILPVWTCAVIAVGVALRANWDYVNALKDRAESAESHRESEIARHVGDERLRIARDLHDSVAHSVSIIAIHAGAVEKQIGIDDRSARSSVRLVRETSREVIDDLQDILSLLRRPPDDDEPVLNVPDVTGIQELVDITRQTDMEVSFEAPDLPDMDVAVRLALYRILQEALTNARKHGDGRVKIVMSRTGESMTLEVSNRVTSTRQESSGFGIIGMRERARSVNGELRIIAGAESWSLRAELPFHARAGIKR